MSLRLFGIGMTVGILLPFFSVGGRAHAQGVGEDCGFWFTCDSGLYCDAGGKCRGCKSAGGTCGGNDECCDGLICEQGGGAGGGARLCTPCRGEGMPCGGAGQPDLCCKSRGTDDASRLRNLTCVAVTADDAYCMKENTRHCANPDQEGIGADCVGGMCPFAGLDCDSDDKCACPIVSALTCLGEGWQCDPGTAGNNLRCCDDENGRRMDCVADPQRNNRKFCKSNNPIFQQSGRVKLLEPLWPARDPRQFPDDWTVPILPGWLTFMAYFMRSFLWILNVAIGFTVIWILIGGFLFMTSGNNQTQRSDAVSRIRWAIAGLLLLLFASVIMRTLNNVFFF